MSNMEGFFLPASFEFQRAQQRTFGQHATVRNFFTMTESHDTDAACFTSLTTDQMKAILDICRWPSLNPFRILFHPKEHLSWMCAQKCPSDGLYKVLQQYQSSTTNGTINLPDYLMIIEQDTYLNIWNQLVSNPQNHYPVHIPYATAGCQIKVELEAGISFPHLGFGAILTKATLLRLLQPVYCKQMDQHQPDNHSTCACWRLQQYSLGEQTFFTEGMSVSDLMHAYSSGLPLTGVSSWKNMGYCVHGNHALAYFINFYLILAAEDTEMENFGSPSEEQLRQFAFVQLTG